MPVTIPDHYAVLGIAPGATAADVRAAYRRRSREAHPDRNRAPDANRQMAAINEAYAVLGNPERRADYDRRRPRPAEPPRPFATPPAEGPGAPQPERLPDWYEFLDLRHGAPAGDVMAAVARTGRTIRSAGYAPADEDRLLRQLRTAAETLMTPATRAVYDRALEGTPPPPGMYPHLHEHWYSFLGVSPRASVTRLAERVTDLTASMRKGSPEYREVVNAWKVLRVSESRAAYDAEAGLAPAARR